MSEYERGQRGRIKGRPWGMKPGTRGRISRVFKPGQGMGYDAEFRAKGWQPMRVKKGEVELEGRERIVYNAGQIVKELLEADPEAEKKAADLIAKWDKAHTTYQDLYQKKLEAHRLFKELGRSIAYERALARARVDKSQVSHQIYGAQIGSTHNYKKTRPVRQCQSFHCKDRRQYPPEQAECPTCGDPLTTRQMPYTFSELHGKMANHMIGVELNDGTRVFFDEPIPPMPSVG